MRWRGGTVGKQRPVRFFSGKLGQKRAELRRTLSAGAVSLKYRSARATMTTLSRVCLRCRIPAPRQGRPNTAAKANGRGARGRVERAKARDVRRSLRLPPPLPSAQGEIRSMGDAAVNQREHAVRPTLIPQDRREGQTRMYFDEAGALRTQACGTVVATSGGDNQSNRQVSRSGCNPPGFFTPYISSSAGPMLTVTTPDHLRASPVPSSQPPERARPPAGGRCGSGTGLTAFNNPLAKRAVPVAGRQPCSTVGVISRRLSQMRVQVSRAALFPASAVLLTGSVQGLSPPGVRGR